MSNNQKDLAIVILIGGKSARFGTERAMIELFQKPLILHQVETLANFDQDIFLIAHSEEQIYEYRKEIQFPREVSFIIDDRKLFPDPHVFKPMLGIYSGFKELNRLGFKNGFLISCDMPLIMPEVLEFMIKESKGYDCCIPKWENGYLEPFFAIYSVDKTVIKSKEILEKNLGLLDLIDENWNINYISIENSIKKIDSKLWSLFNITSPVDLQKLAKIYKYNRNG